MTSTTWITQQDATEFNKRPNLNREIMKENLNIMLHRKCMFGFTFKFTFNVTSC